MSKGKAASAETVKRLTYTETWILIYGDNSGGIRSGHRSCEVCCYDVGNL